MQVTKLVIDERIKDEGCDALRRAIWEAKLSQSREDGFRVGYEEGFADGDQVGYNRALKEFLDIVLDFAKGNRS